MAEKKALLVIDMQNDYLWPQRKPMFSYDTAALTGAVNRAAQRFAAEGTDVIYIAQMFPNIITNKWFIGFSIKGTEGAALYSGLNVVSDLYFEKNLPDAYSAKPFRLKLVTYSGNSMAMAGLPVISAALITARARMS